MVNLKPKKSKIFGSRKFQRNFLGIDELAKLLGKTRYEMEKMLKENDVIELNLNEKRHGHREEEDELRIYE